MNKRALKKALLRDEGVRPKPYIDSVGKTSIGVGRNLTDRGVRATEMNFMLMNDINEAIEELYSAHPWVMGLDDARQEVLANMVFNMGLSVFNTFTQTLSYVRNGQYQKASVEMLDSKWAGQVGSRANRLSKQMKTGQRQ